jgi:hypothetical protein
MAASTRCTHLRTLQLGQHLLRFHLPDLDDPVSISNAETSIDWIKDHISPGKDPTEPGAELCHPIIADDDDGGKDGTKVVEILSITFLIENILPQGSNGIILVLDKECSQTFTYRLDGSHATYLGGVACMIPIITIWAQQQTWCNFSIFNLMMTVLLPVERIPQRRHGGRVPSPLPLRLFSFLDSLLPSLSFTTAAWSDARHQQRLGEQPFNRPPMFRSCCRNPISIRHKLNRWR